MALLGAAALAMWWDMAAEVRSDFEHWHAHEHFPERLAIPGFRRATRWRAIEGDGVFVLYELENHEVLSSPAYAASLNRPTPWSTRLMPHHRHMVRSQCRVLASHGFGLGRYAETLRLSAAPGSEPALTAAIDALGRGARAAPGLLGLHLLHHETPALAATTEQRLRGNADANADLVIVVTAYDEAALAAFAIDSLGAEALAAAGAGSDIVRGRYALAASATPADLA